MYKWYYCIQMLCGWINVKKKSIVLMNSCCLCESETVKLNVLEPYAWIASCDHLGTICPKILGELIRTCQLPFGFFFICRIPDTLNHVQSIGSGSFTPVATSTCSLWRSLWVDISNCTSISWHSPDASPVTPSGLVPSLWSSLVPCNPSPISKYSV